MRHLRQQRIKVIFAIAIAFNFVQTWKLRTALRRQGTPGVFRGAAVGYLPLADPKADPTDIVDSVQPQMPLISVCMPVYEGSRYPKNILQNVTRQTYPNLEIIISLEFSADANLSLTIVKDIQETISVNQTVSRRIRVYQQKERLGFIHNSNFVMKKATGRYVAMLPHGDRIPLEYYEKLFQCLEQHPQAVNCYPNYKYIYVTDETDPDYNRTLNYVKNVKTESIRGSLDERVRQSLTYWRGHTFRGLVRCPDEGIGPFLLQEMYMNSPIADVLQMTQYAIAGELIESDVPYFKIMRYSSTHQQELRTWKMVNRQKATIDRFAQSYNLASMHMSSSRKFYIYCRQMVKWTAIRNQMEFFNQRIAQRKRVAVLGGGIQGTIMALLFSKYGYDVTIFDKSTALLNRASNSQEGKIHLGLVYSNDKTMKTGKHMLESALHFSSYTEYLLNRTIDWKAWKSTKFQYLVPYDSLLSPNELEDYFSKLQDDYHSMLKTDPSLSYLGERPSSLYRRIPLPTSFNASFFQAAFETDEYAISHEKFKSSVNQALKDNSVRVFLNTYVKAMQRLDSRSKTGKFRLVTTRGEHDVDVVVNCLWEGRHAIDKQMGLEEWSGSNIRLKFGFITKYINKLESIESTTIVNGPFGDYVNYPSDDKMYFSWYPISMHGMTNKDIPQAWEDISNGNISEGLRDYQIQKQEKKLNELFANINFTFHNPRLVGGFILGNGDKDVIHMDSQLHKRSDEPIVHQDGYFSVSTQKFTSGPYNAYLLEERFLKNKNRERKAET